MTIHRRINVSNTALEHRDLVFWYLSQLGSQVNWEKTKLYCWTCDSQALERVSAELPELVQGKTEVPLKKI